MGGANLVVSIGADQHQVPHIRLGKQTLEKIERRRVEPLQIVEKQRQRMLRPSEYGDESPEHELKTTLCLLRRKLRNWRLFTDDELQVGDEVDHEPSVWPQRFQQGVAPARQLGLGLAEKRPRKALESLHQCRIGDVAFVLVELTLREKAARQHQRLV